VNPRITRTPVPSGAYAGFSPQRVRAETGFALHEFWSPLWSPARAPGFLVARSSSPDPASPFREWRRGASGTVVLSADGVAVLRAPLPLSANGAAVLRAPSSFPGMASRCFGHHFPFPRMPFAVLRAPSSHFGNGVAVLRAPLFFSAKGVAVLRAPSSLSGNGAAVLRAPSSHFGNGVAVPPGPSPLSATAAQSHPLARKPPPSASATELSGARNAAHLDRPMVPCWSVCHSLRGGVPGRRRRARAPVPWR